MKETNMGISDIPDDWCLIGVSMVVFAGLYLAFNRPRRVLVLPGISLRGRKTSTAATPPRSISPEKKSSVSTGPSKNYADALPPQRRHVLTAVQEASAPPKKVDEAEVKRFSLPMTMDYRTSRVERYTPTGFSTEEIKALGDFPDYAKLCGGPLPQPYNEFSIDKARPRPYRPFRWAYHQTMCELAGAALQMIWSKSLMQVERTANVVCLMKCSIDKDGN